MPMNNNHQDVTIMPVHQQFSDRYCPVCDSTTLHRIKYRKWGYSILQCLNCKVLLTDVPKTDPSVTSTSDFYGAMYFEGGRSDGYSAYGKSRPILLEHSDRFLKRHILPYHSSGRLLDVGCAYGYFVEAASKYFQATGIDVSEHSIAQAKLRGLDCRRATVSTANLESGCYNAATLLDCIEHLHSPREDLIQIREALCAGGILAITTGDVSAIYPRIAGRYWRLLTPPQHVYYFSCRNLVALLESVDFHIVSICRDVKSVPICLIAYQLCGRLGLPTAWTTSLPGSLPLTLLDTVTVVARKQ